MEGKDVFVSSQLAMENHSSMHYCHSYVFDTISLDSLQAAHTASSHHHLKSLQQTDNALVAFLLSTHLLSMHVHSTATRLPVTQEQVILTNLTTGKNR